MAKKNKSAKRNLLLSAMLITSVALLPTTIVFFVGMMPTIVARVTDRTVKRTRALTVGFMNFAGCFPIWFQLMQKGHNFENAVMLILEPLNVVIMYGGALVGYMIEWALAGVVAGMMVQKGHKRLKDIQKAKEDLIARYGTEVTGDLPLDIHGFPVDSPDK